MIWIILLLSPIIFSIPTAIAWYLFRKNLAFISVIGLFISTLLAIYIYQLPDSTYTYNWIPSLDISFTFIVDYLSRNMGVLTTFIALLIGLYSLEYMKHDYRIGWYWFFFNTFTSSMLLVVYSDNLLSLLIGWEGLGLSSWALIGHWFRDDDELSYVGVMGRKVWKLRMFWSPSFAGWRAISTIRIGDIPMFFAIAVIFALTNNLNISTLDWYQIFNILGVSGTTLLFLAFLMGPFTKSAQLPFSEWLMTAMTGPTTVSALLHSATMVAAGAYLFMRLSWYVEPWNHHELETVYTIVLLLGLISAFYGSLVGLACRERKVLLASSTLSSLGIMFAVTSLSFWFGRVAIVLAFLYLVVHALSKATLFLVAGHLIHATHDRFHCKVRNMIPALIVTLIATLCLSGIPPFTAYWIKSGMEKLLHHLEEFCTLPLILFLLTSIAYSASLGKFLSLNFLKGEEKEILLHREILMPFSYMLMCLTLIPLIAYVIRLEGLDLSSLIVGIVLALSYVVGVIKPTWESKIGKVLNDRLYLMALNDLIVPGFGKLLVAISYYLDKAVDLFAHSVIPEMFENISNAIRSVQRRRITRYVEFVIALIFFILLLAGWFEWRF